MREAAEALRLTAQDLNKLGVCDVIVGEPVGGAQRHKALVIESVGKAIAAGLKTLGKKGPEALRHARRRKYLEMGSHALVA